MAIIKNISFECIMNDGHGNEYPAKVEIAEATTDGFRSWSNNLGGYQHELKINPSGFSVYIQDGMDDNDNEPIKGSIKLKHWRMK